MKSPRLGTGVWIIFRDAAGNGVTAPLALYEVVEASPSRYWVPRKVDEHVLAVWPEAFEAEHFFEDTAERSRARETLASVHDLLEREAKSVA
jgi:hypothetical protein